MVKHYEKVVTSNLNFNMYIHSYINIFIKNKSFFYPQLFTEIFITITAQIFFNYD